VRKADLRENTVLICIYLIIVKFSSIWRSCVATNREKCHTVFIGREAFWGRTQMKSFNEFLIESANRDSCKIVLTIASIPGSYQESIYCDGFNLLKIKELSEHEYVEVSEGCIRFDFSHDSFANGQYSFCNVDNYAIAIARYLKENYDSDIEIFKGDGNTTPIPVLF
jgi:hypothetical protein